MTVGQNHSSPFRLFAVKALISIAAFGGLALFVMNRWLDASYRFGNPLTIFVAYLVGVNLTVLILYWYDKTAAIRGYTRVPERILLVLALAGGSPMALVSARLLRHKTIKRSYNYWLGLVLFIQVAAVFAVFYFSGDTGHYYNAY